MCLEIANSSGARDAVHVIGSSLCKHYFSVDRPSISSESNAQCRLVQTGPPSGNHVDGSRIGDLDVGSCCINAPAPLPVDFKRGKRRKNIYSTENRPASPSDSLPSDGEIDSFGLEVKRGTVQLIIIHKIP